MKTRKPGTFEKGNRASVGNKGGGRPADWFKAKCLAILEKPEVLGFLSDCATGKDIDQRINDNGECLKVPASVKDRQHAIEMLKDWAIGKTPQAVELTGKDGEPFTLKIVRADGSNG